MEKSMDFKNPIGFNHKVVSDHLVKIYFNGEWKNAMGWREGRSVHHMYI